MIGESDGVPVPGLGEAGAPVFEAPWQARAFALTLALHERGLFTWQEWARHLGAVIAAAGPQDDGGRAYWHCWVEALETLLRDKEVDLQVNLQVEERVGSRSHVETRG